MNKYMYREKAEDNRFSIFQFSCAWSIYILDKNVLSSMFMKISLEIQKKRKKEKRA